MATLAAAIAIAHGLAPWIGSWIHFPHDTLAMRAYFRPEGDFDYYPMLRHFAEGNFGEPSYWESYGEGLDPYPLWSLLPHSFLIRVFGSAGYLIGDVLVNLVFLGSLWLLLRAFRLNRWLALSGALLITVGIPQDLLTRGAGLPAALELNFWNARIPREFVTTLYVLWVWFFLVRIATDRASSLRLRMWLGLGVCLGVLLQSETFAAVNAAILSGIATVGVLLWNRRQWKRILLYAALAVLAFAVVSIPFFVQQYYVHPDAMRRYGVFIVPRTRPLVSLACHARLAETGVVIAAAFFLLPRVRCGLLRQWRVRRQLFAIGVAVIISFFALPISCIVLGKAGHVYHFDSFIEVVCSHALLLALLVFLDGRQSGNSAPRRPERTGSPWRALSAATVGAVLIVSLISVGVQSARRSVSERPPDERYWADFREMLASFAESPALRRTEILGAFDLAVLNWWGAFGPRWAYVAQAWLTPLGDDIQEDRLLLFCRLVGMRDQQLPEFLRNFHVKVGLLAMAKYEASRGHTFSPLEDYDPADRAVILRKSVDDSWHVVVPNSEVRRLARRYAETSWQESKFRLPDVIVLTSQEQSLGLCPPASEYSEVFRNATFTAWIRRVAR